MVFPRSHIDMPAGDVAVALRCLLKSPCPEVVSQFQKVLGEFLSNSGVLLVGSGRDALRALLQIVDWPPGAEIIFPSYTYHPMPLEVSAFGFQPIFADVQKDTWNLDPKSVVKCLSSRTRAVVPTHFLGLPADLEELREICDQHKLMLIEDCAHAFGSTYHGSPVGTVGDAGIFTFAMSKNMPCFGGGALTVRDPSLQDVIETSFREKSPVSSLSIWKRQWGNVVAMLAGSRVLFPLLLYPLLRLADSVGSARFDQKFIEPVNHPASSPSKSCPISPLQAEIGLRQMTRFPRLLHKHTENAGLLRSILNDRVEIQRIPPDRTSAFLSVRVLVKNPGLFRLLMRRHGVDTRPDEMRDCASLEVFPGQAPCPVSRLLAGNCIEIPCNHTFSTEEVERIGQAVLVSAEAE